MAVLSLYGRETPPSRRTFSGLRMAAPGSSSREVRSGASGSRTRSSSGIGCASIYSRKMPRNGSSGRVSLASDGAAPLLRLTSKRSRSVPEQAPQCRLEPLLEVASHADIGERAPGRLTRLRERVAERLQRRDDLALARC